jgi:hypothetical protein
MNTDSTWHLFIHSSELCWLATADAQGQPNVSPKEVFAAFHDHAKPLIGMAGDKFNIQGVMVVEVMQAHPILAPSYLFYPDSTTESAQIEAAMKAYGVRIDK